MTTTAGAPRYAVDLITFADPEAWLRSDFADLAARAQENPTTFWDRLLDLVSESGATGIELTFEPMGMRTATRAYGGAQQFAEQLAARGLAVVSGYFVGSETQRLLDAAQRRELVAEAVEFADVLRACGSSTMVGSLPLRLPAGADDSDFVAAVVEGVSELASAVAERGCGFSLHTESHSAFWTADDVDRYLGLLDPAVVGFCPDTAHLTLAGSDPVAVCREHRDRIQLVHWKDAAGTLPLDPPDVEDVFATHRPHFRTLGAGDVDLSQLISTLRDTDLLDLVLLEIDQAADPVVAVRDSIATFSGALARA